MDLTNQQVALIAIFLVLTGAVAFNLNGITGAAVSDTTHIIVAPVMLSAGENLHITINPGTEGSTNKIEFFKAGSKVGETVQLCQEQRCYERTTVIYDTPKNWESGHYIAHIFDYTNKNYVQDEFNIE
ncbi:MAG: hypothetical protein Q7R96_00950 [Nanoarchaeota archaeon]|nr:hypothetical protein [Nanoarchaeota archaeon]